VRIPTITNLHGTKFSRRLRAAVLIHGFVNPLGLSSLDLFR
jgi:hypothetical protein